jgi:hypothetical protein
MANILTAVKEGIQSYWEKVYSCNIFNQMWILKYCKDLLDRFNSLKMSAICIKNYFVEKGEALIVFFSVYGFL